jgi:hypothetical protein
VYPSPELEDLSRRSIFTKNALKIKFKFAPELGVGIYGKIVLAVGTSTNSDGVTCLLWAVHKDHFSEWN